MNILCAFVKINLLYLCGAVYGFFILFYWSVFILGPITCCLDYHSIKILKSNWLTLPTFFFFFLKCFQSVQFSSVTQSCPTVCNPVDCSIPGLPVDHQLPEFTQTHVHWVSDAIQPSHPLSSPSPPGFNLSQHPGLFKWVSSSHQVVKILEFQLQHQSFQWIFRTDFL